MKKTMKTFIAIMTVSVMALTACSPFHPSKDLAGSAAIEKSIDGLEKLDDKKTEQFLQAVNKKYAVTMSDISAAADMKTVLSVDLGDARDSCESLADVSGDVISGHRLSIFLFASVFQCNDQFCFPPSILRKGKK